MLVQTFLMVMFDQVHFVELFDRRSILRVNLKATLHKLADGK